MRQTVVRSALRAQGYRPSFRAGVANRWEKRSAGNTNLLGIPGPEPSASGPGWLQQPREHRLAWYGYCRPPQIPAPEALAATWAEAPMACLQFRREKECRDPLAQIGRREN